MRRATLAALFLAGTSHAALAAEPSPALSPIVVTAPTPLSQQLDASTQAAPVQTATALDITRSHAIDLAAFLNREMGGVYVNDVQNNPLQPDINYRGYTASPLLGTAQGLSL